MRGLFNDFFFKILFFDVVKTGPFIDFDNMFKFLCDIFENKIFRGHTIEKDMFWDFNSTISKFIASCHRILF